VEGAYQIAVQKVEHVKAYQIQDYLPMTRPPFWALFENLQQSRSKIMLHI